MKDRILNKGFLYLLLAVIGLLVAGYSAGNISSSTYLSEEKTDSFVLFENTGLDSDVYMEINDSEDLIDKKCFTMSRAIPGFISEGIPTISIRLVDFDPQETHLLIMHNLPPPLA